MADKELIEKVCVVLKEWDKERDFLEDLVDGHSSVPEEDAKLWKAMSDLEKVYNKLYKE